MAEMPLIFAPLFPFVPLICEKSENREHRYSTPCRALLSSNRGHGSRLLTVYPHADHHRRRRRPGRCYWRGHTRHGHGRRAAQGERFLCVLRPVVTSAEVGSTCEQSRAHCERREGGGSWDKSAHPCHGCCGRAWRDPCRGYCVSSAWAGWARRRTSSR